LIAEMRDAGKSNGTINRTITVLRRMFAIAVDSGLLTSAPKLKKLPEDNARQGFLEPAEFATVHGALPEYLRDPIAFLYHSFWRKGEMKTLEWRDVDLPGRVVRLRAENSKTGKGRALMLEGELYAIIERAAANRNPACPFVFHRSGRRIGDFRKSWKKATHITGFAGMDLRPHDLRRSGVRNGIRAGTPESVVMAQSGHQTNYMLKRYNIISEADLRAAALRADEYVRSRTNEPAKVIPLRKAG
jgi:integrase